MNAQFAKRLSNYLGHGDQFSAGARWMAGRIGEVENFRLGREQCSCGKTATHLYIDPIPNNVFLHPACDAHPLSGLEDVTKDVTQDPLNPWTYQTTP